MERMEKQFPVGSGGKFVEKRKELSLSAVEVANKVLWVNPAFKEAPFKLEKGKSTKLGMFFTEKINSDAPDTVPKKKRNLALMPEVGYFFDPVGRSGLIGEIVFRDKEGNFWRDVDIKGIGAFTGDPRTKGAYKHFQVKHIDDDSEKEKTAFGLLDYGYALHDKEYSEMFLQAGIRTHRVLAIIEPKEIVSAGRARYSIDEAKYEGIIPKSIHPVIEARAFGTKERVMYLKQTDFQDRARMAVEDAQLLVAQELEKQPDAFSTQEYVEWFAETLGKQVAKIRKLKLHHGYLQNHNITLDCRIVDLDSVTTAEEALKMRKENDQLGSTWNSVIDLYNEDRIDAQETLQNFIETIEQLGIIEHDPQFQVRYALKNKFLKAYHKELRVKEIKEKKEKKKKG